MTARERLAVVLEKTGAAAKRSLGQNFLVSDLVIERIHGAVSDLEPLSLIEVGPGAGALTDGLLARGLPLRLVELDSGFAAYWRERGAEVLEADALRIDWDKLVPGPRCVLVSNLPYQISSSLVIDRCLGREVAGMVLMFQKEVAQRLRASASTEDYGMLSVIAQTFWKIDVVTEAGPRDFSPAPRVASRVLVFRPVAGEPVGDRQRFLSFVKAAFSQRRKLLRKNLSGWMGPRGLDEAIFMDKIASFGLKETARAEELSPARFVELYEHLDRSRK